MLSSRSNYVLVAVLLLGLLQSPLGHAHGPAPAPLEVVLLEKGTFYPDVVRTNIGVALAASNGSFTYGCPSQWGGVETAFSAATSDRSLMVMVAGGLIYGSTDRGCSFHVLEFPLPETQARNVLAWGEFIYVLAAIDGTGVLYRLDSSLMVELVREFDGAIDSFTMTEKSDGSAVLMLAGGGSKASLWLASMAPEAKLLDWSPLPDAEAFKESDFVSVRGIASDESLWLRVSQNGSRSLFRADLSQDSFEWNELGSGYTVVHGPVWTGKEWIAVLDGRIARWESEAWTLGVEVNWSCLQSFQGYTFVCTLQQIFALTADLSLELPNDHLEAVFHLNQIGAPVEECLDDFDAQIECKTDWLHFGGESGFVGEIPSQSPDGIRPIGIAQGASSQGGCSGGAQLPKMTFLMFALLAGLFMRADRRLRREGRR